MVTCKVDSVALPTMNSVRPHKQPSSSSKASSGFRLVEGEHLESTSSVSRNSVYKLKIDLMFDDTRSVHNNRLDDPRGSHRTRSIIMYGRSELASTASAQRSITSILHESNDANRAADESAKTDVRRINNSVQQQIEQLFTDVAKDATSSFAVTCLGAVPLKDKVTSLQGLQVPLRELYMNELIEQKQRSGHLDICATGLRVKVGSDAPENSSNVTPFHNIAVWSAVKFVLSEDGSGAAFLPLITDPENIDKSLLFQTLRSSEHKRVASTAHAPIFAVVMRSAEVPKLLECHGFICKATEDAIVIAATLYQSLMAHVSTNSQCSTKRRTPRNQNGVSCISIASSSAQTASNYLLGSQFAPSGRKSSFRSSNGSHTTKTGGNVNALPPAAARSMRKKRAPNSSPSCSINRISEAAGGTADERKRKSHKTKRAPPVPSPGASASTVTAKAKPKDAAPSASYAGNACLRSSSRISTPRSAYSHESQQLAKANYAADEIQHASEVGGGGGGSAAASTSGSVGMRSETNGDILTRVAIPRSGSFLNTGGLTRYKSRAARRHTDKADDESGSVEGGGGAACGGGGGGSPLGFSELFNEFRLHENLHSLDDILYAIIDADGMSFNDLKPIYKEFLLKLAVTLTKDELYQRSKNIMRRQRKKKVKRKNSSGGCQKKPRMLLFGTKGLKKVFQLDQFRSCRGKASKPPKPARHKERPIDRKAGAQLIIGPPIELAQQQRGRVVNSSSDVSVIRPENGFNGLNRNSSSGYVSCSECSYDSEACTCASADRCYCSLRTDQASNKHRRRRDTTAVVMARKLSKELQQKQQLKKLQQQQQQQFHTPDSSSRSGRNNILPTNNGANNRYSLISCKSDDKCYCSMVEEEPSLGRRVGPDEEEDHTHSDTTWCDTDSCLSASKCYCQRKTRRSRSPTTSPGTDDHHSDERRSSSPQRQRQRQQLQPANHKVDNRKLALDYELFTINGGAKPVQPHEALSVKKSVEAAAIFADVKLRQTTDIKSLCSPTPMLKQTASRRSGSSSTSRSSSRQQDHFNSKINRSRESMSSSRKNDRHQAAQLSSSCNSSQKSHSADDLLTKLSAIDEARMSRDAPLKNAAANKRQWQRDVYQVSLREKHFQNNYHSMKAVSATLEDSLGYLP